MEHATVCVIVPAKARSTRIPGKNLKLLAGKPLLAYILETAKSAQGIDRLIVTTESEEIADVARGCGADVPFMRPATLTSDETTSQEVLKHAIGELKRGGYEPDYVMLLYPTSPLLKKERI